MRLLNFFAEGQRMDWPEAFAFVCFFALSFALLGFMFYLMTKE